MTETSLKHEVIELVKDTVTDKDMERDLIIAQIGIDLNKKFKGELSLTNDELYCVLLMNHISYEGITIQHIEERFGKKIAEYLFAVAPYPAKKSDDEYYNYKRIGHNQEYTYTKILFKYADLEASILLSDKEAFIGYINGHERFKRLIRTYFDGKFNHLFEHGSELIKKGKRLFKNAK